MKYYVYKHTRLDNNEPFYIGIGNINPNCKKRLYHRAYTSSKRSVIWKNIVNKVGYKVEIVFESDSQDIVKSEEIRLIKLYGRKDQKTGILVNFTNGGDGRLAPNKKSMLNVGWNLRQYTDAKKKKVYQYSLEGNFIKEWNSLTDVFMSLNDASSSGVLQCCQHKIRQYKGSIWRYTREEDFNLRDKKSTGEKKIGRYDLITNKLLEVYFSLKSAAESINGSFKAISLAALGKTKSSGGYAWKYL